MSDTERLATPAEQGQESAATRVCAVVVNYRSAAETIACVESLWRSGYPNLGMVVVDNGSGDGSPGRLAAALRGVEIIETGRNGGYAAGVNAGIRAALGRGAELLWLLTPDVRVEPGCLGRLVEALSCDPRLGICGPVVHAGDRCLVGCRIIPRLGWYPRHCYCDQQDSGRLPALLPTDYVDGCAMLVRRQVVEQTGPLSEAFFLYFEDAEYCLRARRSGWTVALCGRAAIRTRPMHEERNQRAFYLVRNSLLLARLEGRYVARTVLRHVLRALLHLLRLKRATARDLLSATRRGIRAGLSAPLCPAASPAAACPPTVPPARAA